MNSLNFHNKELGFLPIVHPSRHHRKLPRDLGLDLNFGESMDSLQWMVDLAVRAGIKRIVLNGSFVTDIIEPNDVDCVLLVLGRSSNQSAEDELSQGLPFLDISMVGATDFEFS